MPSEEPIREIGEDRLLGTAGIGQLWRSPLFLFPTHGLVVFQTWQRDRPADAIQRSPEGRRLVSAVGQQVGSDWQPLHITGAGGGGGERAVHWIELELPSPSASAVRFSYTYPALIDLVDQIAILETGGG
jgi:hypothetical protein